MGTTEAERLRCWVLNTVDAGGDVSDVALCKVAREIDPGVIVEVRRESIRFTFPDDSSVLYDTENRE